jgi:glycosyltransferase involved in cell wall biosynthesis
MLAMTPPRSQGAVLAKVRNARLLSIVLPFYNEELVIPPLFERLLPVLRSLGCPYEIIAVDDGSFEPTRAALSVYARQDPAVRIVCLARNFGLQAAISAGLKHSTGDAVVLMDGDLQDPPELIPTLYEKWQTGGDVVFTTKRTRAEAGARRFFFDFFHKVLSGLAQQELPVSMGNFSLMDRKAVDVINALPESHRYLPALRTWVGFHQVEVPFDREARAAGQPQMGLARLFSLGLDAIFGFSYLPLRMATLLGFIACALGIGMVGWVLVEKFLTHTAVASWPSLMIAVCLLGGAQLVSLGVVGEYIARIYDEVRSRPHFVVRDVLSFKSGAPSLLPTKNPQSHNQGQQAPDGQGHDLTKNV